MTRGRGFAGRRHTTGIRPPARVFCLLLLAVLPWTHAQAKSLQPQSSSPRCAESRAAVKAVLTSLAAAQMPNGDIVLSGPEQALAWHPLLATIGFNLYSHDRDLSFLGDHHELSSRYVNFVLTHSDRDGDFLMERTSWHDPGGRGLEDVGYNTLLALDLLNLSRICAELGRPVDALFWYQGSRTIERQVVQNTYDSGSQFFFAHNNNTARRENLYLGLSAMPALFEQHLGDNLSASIVRNYLLKNQKLDPESPHRYLAWYTTNEDGADSLTASHVLRSALLLATVHQTGFENDATRFATQISQVLDKLNDSGSIDAGLQDKTLVDYFSCLIKSSEYTTLFPLHHELELLVRLGGLHGVLQEKHLADLDHSVTTIKHFLHTESSPVGNGNTSGDDDVESVEQAMRRIYWTISSLRTKWRTRSLFTPRDRNRIPGFDIYAAFDELLEDVVSTLRDVETSLSTLTARKLGLEVAATLANESVLPGEVFRIRVAVRALGQAVEVNSILLYHNQRVDTLLAPRHGLRMQAGDADREYWFQDEPPTTQGTLHAMRFSTELRLADGRRLLFHFDRGGYVTNPITYTVNFPNGTILTDGSVPVVIEIAKNVDKSYVVNAEWYSPAGLNLHEGPSFELFLPEDQSSGSIRANVLVPTPCRPGAFPFLIKVFGNGIDWGTYAASMFRHYQWVYVGPFPTKNNAMDRPYPPEHGVNLRARYPGVIRPISWMTLPNSVYGANGEIDLTSLVPHESVSYLHTVIRTALEKQTTMSILSRSPAAVFINGQEVLRLQGPTLGALQQTTVTLTSGMNNILIKLLSGESKKLFFQLGNEEDLSSDEYNNNLWELVDGFKDFYERSQNQQGDQIPPRVVTLTYRNPQANSVAVIGSFNGWSPVNSSMRRAGPEKWEISLHLSPGRYAYRFLVDNNSQIVDPASSSQEPDGYGGMNSVLVVR
ncbi:MAG: glycogen-binding domain-containing protein [Candidatus Krumholzibacteria bacterium]|nr:glycogen-binding domain-containing protein [Candidatus Krumholzibacteria bacterium]